VTRVSSQSRQADTPTTAPPGALPARIAPMMAGLGEVPRDQSKFAFEFKWDGVRALTYCDRGGRTFRIESRNLLDITQRYPELHALREVLGERGAVIDGEIVALDELDRPSFARLQQRMHVNDAGAIRRLMREVPVFYFIFDLLWLDGRSTIHLPYVKRRELLEELTLAGPNWQRTIAELGEGSAMLHAAKELGMEGVVAKKLDSLYHPGRRSPDWIKIKLVGRQEFVIGGWTPEEGTEHRLGALLVGYYEFAPAGAHQPSRFRYAGKVGSGFNSATHELLAKLLKLHARTTSPFSDKIPNKARARWVEPTLVAEVEYRGWTDNQMLRQPAFKGLREDKQACEVIREGT
jgi:bifunctional non-homologous end joining protein LigD